MDRRALFFLAVAAVAVLLIPVTDKSLQYVPKIVSVTYVVLSAASYLDWRTTRR
jgi:flagellar biosynthesis protein FliQ